MVLPDDRIAQLATAIVAVLAVARVVHLIVDDDWPPVVRFRAWFAATVPDGWVKLVECPWCAAPYIAAPQVALLAIMWRFPSWSALYWVWWCVCGWAALSWLASYVTLRDIPPESRE